MLFSQTIIALVACFTYARAGYLTSSAAEAIATADLGELDSLDAFFAMLGTNSSQWTDISEYETPDDPAIVEAWRNTPPNTTILDLGLSTRQNGYDYCQDLTGFARIVCENMPRRYGIWVAGGSMLIYYGPTAIANWLEEIARAIRAGRDLKATYIGDSNGGTGSSPVEDRAVASWGATAGNTNIHFTVPVGSPDLVRRSVSEDGTITDIQVSNEYVYNTAARELTYDATQATFSVGLSDAFKAHAARGRFGKRAPTSDYTILLRSSRQTSALTVAQTGCIRSVLKTHLDASSETNRFGCYPIDNNGAWKAKLHVNINKGRFNYGTYGRCC